MELTRDAVMAWVAGYERAWRTPGPQLPEALGALFTDDATYRPGPYAQPVVGLPAIEAFWTDEREGPDEVFTMNASPVAVEGDTGVVRLQVTYGDPDRQEYADLWIMELTEGGRCSRFEEWPFWPPESAGVVAGT